MARLLLVEDDEAIGEPLVAALEREGYSVTWAPTGTAALKTLTEAPGEAHPDLVVLDLGLPDVDGIEVCRRLRREHPTLPVVMLTARAEEIDTVVGLDAGADDYVTKPFRLAELLARLRARLRAAETTATTAPEPERVLAAADVRVDVGAHRAFVGDRELELTPKEFGLLALLVREAGHAVPRDRIMREVWDEHWYGSTKTLDMHVSWLRRKLGDDAHAPTRITTVRGVGFRFERPGR